MAEPGRIQGEFRLLHKIGEGGMADVFLAERMGDDGFKTRVALKRLHRGLAMDSYFIRQLVREARLLGQLEHANIVKVYDLRRIGDEYYVVMEFVDGIDLAAVVKVHRTRKTRIPRPFFFHVALSLSEALSYAHAAVDPEGNPTPLIHRDIKPSNVMLSRRGIVKLTDFGIAHVGDGSVTGGLVQGTANYMSPEQAFGEERLLPASDVYSLGSVFYEMLSGRPLVDGDNYLKAIHQVRERRVTLDELAGLGVEPGLRMVVAKMLSADQTGRYQEMESVRNDLQFVAERLKIDLSWHRIRAYVGRLMGILGRAPDRATLSNLQVPEEIREAARGVLAPQKDVVPEGPATPATPPPQRVHRDGHTPVTHAVRKDLIEAGEVPGAEPIPVTPVSLGPTTDSLPTPPPSSLPTPPPRPPVAPGLPTPPPGGPVTPPLGGPITPPLSTGPSTPLTPRTPVPALSPSQVARAPKYQGETVSVAKPDGGPGSSDDPLAGAPPVRPPVSLGPAPGTPPRPPVQPPPRPAPPPPPMAPPEGWDDEATRVYTGQSPAESGVMGAGPAGAIDGPETRPMPEGGPEALESSHAMVDLGETTIPPSSAPQGLPQPPMRAPVGLAASSAGLPIQRHPQPPAPAHLAPGGQPTGGEEETDTETWVFEDDGAGPAAIAPSAQAAAPDRPRNPGKRRKKRRRRNQRPVSPLLTTILVVLILLLLCAVLLVIAIKQDLIGSNSTPTWNEALTERMIEVPGERWEPHELVPTLHAQSPVPDNGAERA
jgi:eukaryotic-like serine/threonine-protein kinase